MENILLVLLGLSIGVLGTMIGAGGGFLLMPILLLYHPDWTAQTAAAISLAVVCANALSGSVSYGLMGWIDYRSGSLFIAAGLPGSIAGALTVAYIPRSPFNFLFGLVLLAAGTFIITGRGCPASAESHAPERPPDKQPRKLALGGLLSFAIGFAASLLGIGGGILHVPVLVYLLGFPVHTAAATSHFVLANMAAVGTSTYVVAGALRDHYLSTGLLAAGAVVGAQVGSRLARRICGRSILRLLGGALALVGIRLLVLALYR